MLFQKRGIHTKWDVYDFISFQENSKNNPSAHIKCPKQVINILLLYYLVTAAFDNNVSAVLYQLPQL